MLIGLTGGIGSGKTIVANLFRDLNIRIIDADAIGREISNKPKIFEQIVEHFGKQVLLSSNILDRAKLRKIIFNSKKEKKWLENLLHPLIKEEILKLYKAIKEKYCILETAILIESGFYKLVEKIIVVDCKEELQIARILIRNKIPEYEIKKIMSTQLSREERLKYADKVIDNNGDIDELQKQVMEINNWIISLH